MARTGQFGHSSAPAGQLGFRQLLRILLRYRWLIGCLTVGLFVAGVIYAQLQTPLYTSQSVIQFDFRDKQVVDIQSVLMGMSADESAIQSEVDVIKSRYMAERVAYRLQLSNYPEFNPYIAKPGFLERYFNIGGGTKMATEELQNKQRIAVVDNILDQLTIIRPVNTYTVKIQFTSASKELAAKVPNAYINEYKTLQLQQQMQASREANQWLDARVEDLKKKVEISSRRVQEFKEANNLIEIGMSGITVDDTQLSELNTQLTLAKADTLQASARLKQAQRMLSSGDGSAEAVAEVLDSPVIQNLRIEETSLLIKQADLRGRYGTKHPQMQKVTNELNDLRQKIRSEVSKIITTFENQLEIARIKENNLRQELERLSTQQDSRTRARVQLSELEREMDASAQIYSSFLNRYKETSETEDQIKHDVKIVSIADKPLQPSWPNKKLIVLIALIGGLLSSLILIGINEMRDRGFRDPEIVENMTNLPVIGLVQELDNDLLKGRTPVIFAAEMPLSPYAESLRSVLTQLQHTANKMPKVIMVTSSIPGEGKSVFSLALSRLMAKAGKKVLLIDLDMRRPRLHHMVTTRGQYVVQNVLRAEVTLADAISEDIMSPLHLLTAEQSTPDSRELLLSDAMISLLEHARHSYDLVILDTAPVLALSDALAIAPQTDSVLFLNHWGKTKQATTLMALKRLEASGKSPAGIVLNRVNIHVYEGDHYGDSGSYYGTYQEYYHQP